MKVSENVSLKDILWYKIGGTAKYLIEVSSRKDLEEALLFLHEKDLYETHKYFIIGYGSNLIFSKEHFHGAVIRFTSSSEGLSCNAAQNEVTAFAGSSLDSVIQFGFAHHLTGLEWAGGLPGTVGAAIRGNVGAYGGEIKDILTSAEIVELNEGKITWSVLTNEQLHFSYRESLIKQQKQLFVVTGTFRLHPATQEELETAKNIYEEKKQHRKERHPLEYPNCGSVFKNIKNPEQIKKVLEQFPDLKENVETKWYGKVSAAAVIERLGLKGYQVGGAQVSEKHALFIINKDNATAHDVLEIINTIQQKCEERFGFRLEPEVEIVV